MAIENPKKRDIKFHRILLRTNRYIFFVRQWRVLVLFGHFYIRVPPSSAWLTIRHSVYRMS